MKQPAKIKVTSSSKPSPALAGTFTLLMAAMIEQRRPELRIVKTGRDHERYQMPDGHA